MFEFYYLRIGPAIERSALQLQISRSVPMTRMTLSHFLLIQTSLPSPLSTLRRWKVNQELNKPHSLPDYFTDRASQDSLHYLQTFPHGVSERVSHAHSRRFFSGQSNAIHCANSGFKWRSTALPASVVVLANIPRQAWCSPQQGNLSYHFWCCRKALDRTCRRIEIQRLKTTCLF